MFLSLELLDKSLLVDHNPIDPFLHGKIIMNSSNHFFRYTILALNYPVITLA